MSGFVSIGSPRISRSLIEIENDNHDFLNDRHIVFMAYNLESDKHVHPYNYCI